MVLAIPDESHSHEPGAARIDSGPLDWHAWRRRNDECRDAPDWGRMSSMRPPSSSVLRFVERELRN